ncbi:MAG: AraC family transcriptional regulator [Prolixibacteraceae bacterium]|nr:AraC family transcriptional regulator [Prolixibacteraceae bacterium]
MLNDFKYLTNNLCDTNWGFMITVAGSANVAPNSAYPPTPHPNGYDFNWQHGRILQEFQLNYITGGEGIMETREGTFRVKEGTVIVLHPNMWHRYKPLAETGWTEHYVGFMGSIAESLIGSTELLSKNKVIVLGFHEKIIELYHEIFSQVKDERPGYQQICSGLIVQLMGHILSIKKNEDFTRNPIQKAIQKACIIIRENPSENLNIEKIAGELQVNYSHFRKAFKKYTGLSPLQYHTSLRIKQAIDLLTNSSLSIKEISYKLGFCSVFYFSKLFKEKTGKTPFEYRKSITMGAK